MPPQSARMWVKKSLRKEEKWKYLPWLNSGPSSSGRRNLNHKKEKVIKWAQNLAFLKMEVVASFWLFLNLDEVNSYKVRKRKRKYLTSKFEKEKGPWEWTPVPCRPKSSEAVNVCSNRKKFVFFNPCECLGEEWKCLPPPRHEWQTKVRSEAPPGHMPPQSATFTQKEKTMFFES